MIIDFHSHLGNILYDGGGTIANRKDVRRKHPFDPDVLGRAFCYNCKAVTRINDTKYLRKLTSRAEQKRCDMASAENLLYYMDKHGINKTVVHPVAPSVTFDDIIAACKDNDRLIPFGSVDFTRDDIKAQVTHQIKLGARGFKIHPILQMQKADGEKMREMMSACPDGTVIVAHTGYSDYYTKKYQHRQKMEFGDIASFANLATAHPNLRFVAAHAGLRELGEALEILPSIPNVWVDVTFQSSKKIARMIESFGADRVLFGSDWPYGFHKTAIACVRKAVGDDAAVLDKLFFENAEKLLG